MKKLLYMAVAAIAALSSCTSEDIINGNGNGNANAPVFTATIEGEGTRTALANGTKVNWESGDEVKLIFVNTKTPAYQYSVTYTATPGTDATTATLKMKDGETFPAGVNCLLTASYPANSVQTAEGFHVNTTFPATQVYGGDGKMTNIPMVYKYDSDNPNIPASISFCNPTAVLAITVPYTEVTSVKSITISSDLMMNGQVSFAYDVNKVADKTYYFINKKNTKTDDNSKITLDCYSKASQNVAIPEGGSKTFYIAILPMTSDLSANNDYIQASAYGYLQIDVTDGTTTKTMKTKTGKNIEIARNKIYEIAFADNTAPAAAQPKLNIKVTSSDIATLKSIKVVTDKNIDEESKEKVLAIPADQQTPAADGTVYSIEIPSQTYAYYKIYLSADGTTYNEAMVSKNPSGLGEITADMNIDYEANAIRLYADGPLWATMNIGATTVAGGDVVDTPAGLASTYTGFKSCYGNYYKWGETTPNTEYENVPTVNSCDISGLCSEHDAATANWGSAWRTASHSNFDRLIPALLGANQYTPKEISAYDAENPKGIYWIPENTPFGGVTYGAAGTLCVSENALKVFLPAAGYRMYEENYYNSGPYGYFWTSTPVAANISKITPYMIRFKKDVVSFGSTYGANNGFTIRAVTD